jgi:ABC-2 type transport system permease protein
MQLVLMVVLSRLVVTGFGQVSRSRVGAAVIGVLIAGLLIVSQSGWMLVLAVRTSGLLSTSVTPAFATLVRTLPSGWGLYAVESAGRSDWLTAVGVLAGLAAANALLLLAWSRRLSSPRAARATVRGSRRVRIRHAGPLSGPVGAVTVKELHTWCRDPLRVQSIAIGLSWALGTCLLPLTFGSKALLPWAAPAIALMSTVSIVNLYGFDGTALWLTLMIPGAERNDVHGRQRALLFLLGPPVTVAAVALTALAGPGWTYPWVLALSPALLGGQIGLLAWISIAALVPGQDPHRRPDNPTENAGATGPGYLAFWAGLLPCLPAACALLAGTLLHNAPLRWAGIPVGIATGALLYIWLGHLGYRRLEARGPELLLKMRAGRSIRQTRTAAAIRTAATARGTAPVQMPRKQGAIIGFGIPLGVIMLIPQGIIPAALKLANAQARIWFLPLYLAEPLQWPACFVMMALGTAMLCFVLRTAWHVKKSCRGPGPGKEATAVAQGRR